MPRKTIPPPTRVIVTLKTSGVTRKFVVVPEDEYRFDGIESFAKVNDEDDHPLEYLYFGAQWLRRAGVIDEQYRSLTGSDVLSLKRGPA